MTEARVSSEFANALASGRERYNAAFARARHQYGELDPEAFTAYLRELVDPLVVAAARVEGADLVRVTDSAYEVGLSLLGQNLIGPRAREHHIEGCLALLLVPYVQVVVKAPSTVLAALGNATHHLARTPGARPEFFRAELLRLAPEVRDVDTLLALGQVTAWRAGLSHYRAGALARLAEAGEAFGRAALGLAPTSDYSAVLARLTQDPWFDPTSERISAPVWVGAFRGFGGLFVEPPRVTTSQGQLLVRSERDHFLLIADAFGATFHRATDEEISAAAGFSNGEKNAISERVAPRGRGTVTSIAHCEHTTALSFSHSHALLLHPKGVG